VQVFSDRRFNHGNAQRNGKKAPDGGIFVRIRRGYIRYQRPDQIMKSDETPGTVNRRHIKGHQDIGKGMQAPVESEQPVLRPGQEAV